MPVSMRSGVWQHLLLLSAPTDPGPSPSVLRASRIPGKKLVKRHLSLSLRLVCESSAFLSVCLVGRRTTRGRREGERERVKSSGEHGTAFLVQRMSVKCFSLRSELSLLLLLLPSSPSLRLLSLPPDSQAVARSATAAAALSLSSFSRSPSLAASLIALRTQPAASPDPLFL